MIDDIRAIMAEPDWQAVSVVDYGPFVTISGQFRGTAHAGSTKTSAKDWRELAERLDRVARDMHSRPVRTPEPPPRSPDLAAIEARLVEAQQRIEEAREPEPVTPAPAPPPELRDLMQPGETVEQAVERLTPDEDALVALAEALPDPALQHTLAAVPATARAQWIGALNTSLGELRLRRGTNAANLPREAQISRIISMFATAGEQR